MKLITIMVHMETYSLGVAELTLFVEVPFLPAFEAIHMFQA